MANNAVKRDTFELAKMTKTMPRRRIGTVKYPSKLRSNTLGRRNSSKAILNLAKPIQSKIEQLNFKEKVEINQFLSPMIDFNSTFHAGQLLYERPVGPREKSTSPIPCDYLKHTLIGDKEIHEDGKFAGNERRKRDD